MRNLILILVCCLWCCTTYGQDDVYYQPEKLQKTLEHHFKIVDGKIIWQKVFDYNDSINVRDLFIEKNILTDIAETNQKMIGKLKPIAIDFKASGFTKMNIPIYLSASDITCNVSIENKSGKYRVTMDRFVLIDNVTGGVLKKGNETNYETYSIKKSGEFRSGFLKYDVIIFENQFNKLFSIRLDNSEW